MKLVIPKDIFDNPHPPQVFLCTTGKKIIGELPVYDCSLDSKWNAYSEFQFSIDRTYTDVLTGEVVVNPLFDKAEGLRKVYVKNIGFFIIQDRDATHGDNDTKTLSCFSTEYETGSKYLEEFYINTGEVASKEVIYLASQYGDDYTIDTLPTIKEVTTHTKAITSRTILMLTHTLGSKWRLQMRPFMPLMTVLRLQKLYI